MLVLRTEEEWNLQQEDKMEEWKLKDLGFSPYWDLSLKNEKKLYILCEAISSSKLHSCQVKSIIIFILLIPVLECDWLF